MRSMPNEFLFLSSACTHNTYILGVHVRMCKNALVLAVRQQVSPEAPGAGTPGCACGHGALGCAGSRSSRAVLPAGGQGTLPCCTGTGCRDGRVGFGLFFQISSVL